MKFKFSTPSLVVAAGSLEEALAAISSHISTVGRHVGSGRAIEDCKPRFSIEQVDDKTENDDLKDAALEKHGVIALDLDPESSAGVAHAKQISDRKADAEAQAKAKIKDTRTDAENLAEHSLNEQAALKQPA